MSMTISQKQKMRIAVAKDVIKSLPTLNVEQGTYLEGNAPIGLKSKGSKAVAKALKKDFKFGNFEGDYGEENHNVEAGYNKIFDRLKTIFSSVQLALIETAFEKCHMGTNKFSYAKRVALEPWLNLAVEFGVENYDDSDNLRAIMKNIVANDGLFIPIQASIKDLE